MIDRELLEIMACPACKSPVKQEGDWILCTNTEKCGRQYPIRDGIPIMLIEESVLPERPTKAEG